MGEFWYNMKKGLPGVDEGSFAYGKQTQDRQTGVADGGCSTGCYSFHFFYLFLL